MTLNSQQKNLGFAATVPMGDWNASASYNPLNLVRHKTASFYAKTQNQGIEPFVTTGWENIWQICALDGFGAFSPSATVLVNQNTGEAVGEVTTSYDADGNPIFNFVFSGIKGEQGESGTSVNIVSGRYYDPSLTYPPTIPTTGLTPLPSFSSTTQGQAYVVDDNVVKGQVDLYFHGVNGANWTIIDDWGGIPGQTGNGIQSITKTGTNGLIDTYTITFTNGSTTTFTITNGANGSNGTNGANGVSISSVTFLRTEANGDNVYNVNLSNGTVAGTITAPKGATGSSVIANIDTALSLDSTNAVQNKVITAALNAKANISDGFNAFNGAFLENETKKGVQLFTGESISSTQYQITCVKGYFKPNTSYTINFNDIPGSNLNIGSYAIITNYSFNGKGTITTPANLIEGFYNIIFSGTYSLSYNLSNSSLLITDNTILQSYVYNANKHITNYQANFLASEAEKSANINNTTATAGIAVSFDSGNTLSASGRYTSGFIAVKPNTRYSTPAVNTMVGYNTSKGRSEGILFNNYVDKSFTFITGANTYYVRMTSNVSNIMLNEGSTLQPYSPYYGPIVHKSELPKLYEHVLTMPIYRVSDSTKKGTVYLTVTNRKNLVYDETDIVDLRDLFGTFNVADPTEYVRSVTGTCQTGQGTAIAIGMSGPSDNSLVCHLHCINGNAGYEILEVYIDVLKDNLTEIL